MATIVLVCAAGVSGTFLARRLATLSPGLDVRVTTLQDLAGALADVDAVLLAPQVAEALAEVRSLAAPRPVALLSPAAHAPAGAAQAVAEIDAVLALIPLSPSKETESA